MYQRCKVLHDEIVDLEYSKGYEHFNAEYKAALSACKLALRTMMRFL